MSFDLKALRAQAAEVCGQPAHPNKPTYSVAEHKKRLEQKAKEKTQAKKALKKTAESFFKHAEEVMPGWFDRRHEAAGLLRKPPKSGTMRPRMADVHGDPKFKQQVWRKAAYDPKRVAGASAAVIAAGVTGYGLHRWRKARKAMEARRDPDGIEARRSTHTEKLDGRFD